MANTSNQGLRQATVEASTGTTLNYEGDFITMFNTAGYTNGGFNGMLLSWINAQLSTNYPDINGAMYAFSQAKGTPTPDSWGGMGQFTIGGGAGPALVFNQSSNSQYLGTVIHI